MLFLLRKLDILKLTKNGIYCPNGDFYIDASGSVKRNIITHAHADHAKPGHQFYLTHKSTAPLLKTRIGKNIRVQVVGYEEEISINGVKVSLHPAGHIYGSSQIKVVSSGETWVVSGDYKLVDDHLSTPFEPVKCNVFITECTFGLTIFQWPKQQIVYNEINNWWRENREQGITSLLFGYALGKAQNIIKNIDHDIGPVYVHRSIDIINNAIKKDGGKLPDTIPIFKNILSEDIKGNLIIAPPSITSGRLKQQLGQISRATASGWIQVNKHFSKSKIDRGFILSDHADQNGLIKAVKESGAEKIITMHGYTNEFCKYLNDSGFNSMEIENLRHQPISL